METNHHAGMDINSERQPGPRHAQPGLGVDHDDVHGRVVDLYDVQRTRSQELSGDGDEGLQGHRIAPLACTMSSIDASDPAADCPPVRDWHSPFVTPGCNPLDEVGHSRPLRFEVKCLNLVGDNSLSPRIERTGADRTAPPRWKERGRDLSGAELRDEAIKGSAASPEFCCCSPDCCWIQACGIFGQ